MNYLNFYKQIKESGLFIEVHPKRWYLDQCNRQINYGVEVSTSGWKDENYLSIQKVKWYSFVEQRSILFEEVFENCDEETKEKLIFYLDILKCTL